MPDLEKCGEDSTTLPDYLDTAPSPAPPSTRLASWLTVFGGFMAMFCTFGQMNSFGTFQTWYAHHQFAQLHPSAISWIGTLQLWVFFFSGSPIGRLFDTHGPKLLMSGGTVLCLVSMVLQSVSTQLYQYLLFQGVLFGLGVGLVFYPVMAAVSTHFTDYRATALGIVSSGSSIGGVVYPILMQRLFVRVGFGWAVRASGLLTAVLCVASVLTVTRRGMGSSHKRMNAPWVDTKNFNDSKFTLLVGGSFLVALGLFIPFFFIVDYAISIGIDQSKSYYVLAAMNGGGFFGRIAPAILSDRLGRYNTIIPAAFLCGLLVLVGWPFLAGSGVVGVCVWAGGYGFVSGAFVGLMTPCIAQISEIGEVGTRIGMLYTLVSVPALVGGPIAGALRQSEGNSFLGMMMFAGTTLVGGSVLLLAAKLRIDKRLLART